MCKHVKQTCKIYTHICAYWYVSIYAYWFTCMHMIGSDWSTSTHMNASYHTWIPHVKHGWVIYVIHIDMERKGGLGALAHTCLSHVTQNCYFRREWVMEHIYICVWYVYTHRYMYTCIYIYTYMYIHIYIYTYMYKYIYIHTVYIFIYRGVEWDGGCGALS